MAPSLSLLSIVFVVVICFSLVNSTSDPAGSRCAEVCYDEIIEAELCEAVNECDVERQTRKEFKACTYPCWIKSSFCMRMCRRTFNKTLRRCSKSRRCRNDTSTDCVWDCYMQRMLRRKARIFQKPRRTKKKRAQ